MLSNYYFTPRDVCFLCLLKNVKNIGLRPIFLVVMMDVMHKRTLNLRCKCENENKLVDVFSLIYEI